jgi:glycosyltransferase involved in cell wall biosynthesis
VRKKFDWQAVVALARYIERRAIDVVVCTNGYPLLYALVASRLAHRPVRLVEVFHTTGLRTPIKSRVRMLLNRIVFRQCALVVYVSQKQREYWRARWLRARRDIVIHNGVDTDHFTDCYTSEQKAATRGEFGFGAGDYVIGICASLRVEKAHEDLLRALRRLRDDGLAAKVLILGDGPQRPMLEGLIKELRLEADAVISGYRADVRPYIASCDVMTLTSHVVETFSIAALESMSLGKPVVLTRIGGAEEQVTHGVNGLLFEPGDIDALVGNLRDLANVERRRRMGAAAAQSVRERFTLQRMVAKFTDELQRLTDAPRLQLTSTVPN